MKAANGTLVKAIIETCYLTKEEIVKASEVSVEGCAQFVKTSTGFGSYGAKAEDVALMVKSINGKTNVKASGGSHDRCWCGTHRLRRWRRNHEKLRKIIVARRLLF